jgi:hypothetical protein
MKIRELIHELSRYEDQDMEVRVLQKNSVLGISLPISEIHKKTVLNYDLKIIELILLSLEHYPGT